LKEATENKMFPGAWERFLELVKRAREAGLNVGIFEAWRSPSRQDELFRKGTTKAQAWHSWHNYGLAADIVFIDNDNWSWKKEHDWKKLGEIGKALGLKWGGDWGWDHPHFEYPIGMKVGDALLIIQQKNLEGLWDSISKTTKQDEKV
jgi:peptidoglycan L-alanyl-D-glutamate endopeptidase CwlK